MHGPAIAEGECSGVSRPLARYPTPPGRVAATSVTATANASASGHGAGSLVDGSYLNYWQSNGSVPATITLDQGSSKHVAYLAVNQREIFK